MPTAKDTQEAARADLSIVVVTHNRTQLALRTLAAARAAADDLTVEWLVVDSGSTDDTPQAIERAWSDMRVARLENVGFAAANNHALQSARGRYVLLLNPDCTIAEGTLEELVAQLDCRPEVGLASVIQRAPDGSLQYSIRRYPSPWLALGEALGGGRLAGMCAWREEDTREQGYAEERQVDWLVGAFLIARREAIQEVGPLDTRFFLYSEEIDWCYRFRKAGWDVRHMPVMTVTHHTGNEHRPDLLAQLSYAKVLFAHKHYGWRRTRAIRSALMLRHALRVIACGAVGLTRPVWESRMAAERHALAVVSGRADPPFGGARLQTRVSA